MKKLILTLLFLIFIHSIPFLYSLDDNWCEPAIDLSDNFPEDIKDQGDLGYCFAFASTSLIENYNCRKNSLKPCPSLSTMDTISQNPESFGTSKRKNSAIDYDNYHEGGWPHETLAVVKRSGICKEESAPYRNFQDMSQKQAWDHLLSLYRKHPKVSNPDDYEKLKARMDKEYTDMPEPICHDGLDSLYAVEDALRVLDSNGYLEVETAMQKENGREFLKGVFVPEKCINERQSLNYRVNHPRLNSKILNIGVKKDYIEATISDNLKKGIPSVITVKCGPSRTICSDGTSEHAVVIKGMRQNPATGKCEFLVLNSWGEDWQNERGGGNVDADSLTYDIIDIVWLE